MARATHPAPAPHELAPRGSLTVLTTILTTICLLLFGAASGCGDPAFEFYAPETKREVGMAFFPNSGRRGASLEVIALLDIPSARRNFVVIFDAGVGVDQEGFNTGQGQGCGRENVDALLKQLGETRETRFAICFDIAISPGAPVGQRTLKVEIDSDGEPLISRTSFSVLPALDAEESGPGGS